MKKIAKKKTLLTGLALLLVFVGSLLIWPDFSYTTTCDFGDDGNGCAPMTSYNYADFQLGGGWRWAETHNCFQDGKIYVLSSGVCPMGQDYRDKHAEEAFRAPAHMLIGSLATTVIIGLILFSLPRLKQFHS